MPASVNCLTSVPLRYAAAFTCPYARIVLCMSMPRPAETSASLFVVSYSLSCSILYAASCLVYDTKSFI